MIGHSLIVSTQSRTRKKNDNEVHYCFIGLEPCEVTISWQAKTKDTRGEEVEVGCSITFLVNEGGIQEVIGEPMFGGVTNEQEILELVRQNKGIFINGNSLYDAITKREKAAKEDELLWKKNDLPINEENLYINNYSSSGYRNSISSVDSGAEECNLTDIEFEDYGTESKIPSSSVSLARILLPRRNSLETGPVEDRTEQLTSRVTELNLEVDELKQKNRWLEKRKKVAEEECDEYREKEKEQVAELEQKLKNKDEAFKRKIERLLIEQRQIYKERDKEAKKETEGLKKIIEGKDNEILNLTTELEEQREHLQTEKNLLNAAIEKEENEKLRKNMEKAKVLSLEKGLQAEQKKSSNLEKALQDEKTKVFNLEGNLQSEQARFSKNLKAEEKKVANLKKRNSTNISKARKAVTSSIAASLIGLVCLFPLVQSIEYCCALSVISLILFVYCVYNVCTMYREDDHSLHDLSVSRVDSIVQIPN